MDDVPQRNQRTVAANRRSRRPLPVCLPLPVCPSLPLRCVILPLQVMSDATSRPVVGPIEGLVPGVSRLLYHGPASSRSSFMHSVRGLLCPWTCACVPAVSEALRRSRYVQVYDNKIEINEPDSAMVGCGTCVVRDRISTLHFVSLRTTLAPPLRA